MLDMKTVGTLLAVLMTKDADAFFTAPARSRQCLQLFGFRPGYADELEQLKRTWEVEMNGDCVDINAVSQIVDDDIQKSSEEKKKNEARIAALKSDMEFKAELQVKNNQALTIELQKQSLEAHLMNNKLGAVKEKTAIIEKFKANDLALQTEMQGLATELKEAEATISTHHISYGQLLETRIELDREFLSLLKKQYDVDIKALERKLEIEIETHTRPFLMQSGNQIPARNAGHLTKKKQDEKPKGLLFDRYLGTEAGFFVRP